MAVTSLAYPKYTFVDANGKPLAGGLVYTYQAGTSTLATTWTDSSGSTANTNPVVLDVNGQCTIWGLTTQTYDFGVHNSGDVLQYTVQNISGAASYATFSASSGSSLVGFLQAGAGAVTRTMQDKGRDIVSVKDFGAVGDGVTDDGPAIQAAMNASAALYFPSGKYRITSTLTFPSAAPYGAGRLVGAGGLVGDPRTTTRSDSYSALIWDGAVGGTMIVAPGTLGFQVQQLCFVGQKTSGGASRAGILWQFTQPGTYGSGESTFEHCTWLDADVGVQCGTASGDSGCAGLTFIKPTFQTLTRGLYVKNQQGLNYLFIHLSANSVSRVVDCEQGGNLHVFGANLAGCGGATDYPFTLSNLGDNLAANTLLGVRLEQNTKHLLDCRGTGIVWIEGVTEAQTDQNATLVNIQGPLVILSGCRLVSNDATNPAFAIQNHTGGQRAGLVLRDCWLNVSSWVQGDWIGLADTNDEIQVCVERCRYTGNQIALPDFFNRLEHGGFTCFGQTTDATAKLLYFDGGTAASVASTCRISQNSLQILEIHVVGRKSDGSVNASFVRRATVEDTGGVTSLVGALETIGTDVNAGAWAVAFVVSNGFVRVQVTGAVGATIDWRARITARAMKVV